MLRLKSDSTLDRPPSSLIALPPSTRARRRQRRRVALLLFAVLALASLTLLAGQALGWAP